MKNTINCLIGLQFNQKIELRELKDWIYQFNNQLEKKQLGKVVTASVHKKNLTDYHKNLLAISINSTAEVNFDKLLSAIPNLALIKRYLIVDVSNALLHHTEYSNMSVEKFSHIIEQQKLLYHPDQTKPMCIIRSLYQHYYCLEGIVLWYNKMSITINKGKYYARELYCEFNLDAIKTEEGFKVPVDATITVNEDEVFPQFNQSQLILSVKESPSSCKKINDLMTNHFTIIVN